MRVDCRVLSVECRGTKDDRVQREPRHVSIGNQQSTFDMCPSSRDKKRSIFVNRHLSSVDCRVLRDCYIRYGCDNPVWRDDKHCPNVNPSLDDRQKSIVEWLYTCVLRDLNEIVSLLVIVEWRGLRVDSPVKQGKIMPKCTLVYILFFPQKYACNLLNDKGYLTSVEQNITVCTLEK